MSADEEAALSPNTERVPLRFLIYTSVMDASSYASASSAVTFAKRRRKGTTADGRSPGMKPDREPDIGRPRESTSEYEGTS